MSRKARWIIAVIVLLLGLWALVRLDVWYASRKAAVPPAKETAP